LLITGGSGFLGRHLIEHLGRSPAAILNLDTAQPEETGQRPYWTACSLLDEPALRAAIAEFQPTHVVHLAGEITMSGRSVADYPTNVQGVRNLMGVLRSLPSVERVIVTSTQHVRRPGSAPPASDVDFLPYKPYGESKVLTEEITRASDLACTWCIIRPTTVWGLHNPALEEGVWRLIYRRLYFHPSRDPVIRGYGYVGNVAWQIEQLLRVDPAAISGKVFYVGDRNARQADWIDGFARGLTGKKAKTLPLPVIRLLSLIGDVLGSVGIRFPIHASRLRNLTTSNPVPMEPIFEILGEPPSTVEDAIKVTTEGLKRRYQNGSSLKPL
jgi:nucleoside-diphosphate-sugar epimerase